MAGAGALARQRIDTFRGDDGYTERRTRGLNPTRHTWDLRFPFTSRAEHQAMNDFLMANCLAGFWFKPPTGSKTVFATCDRWGATIVDRRPGGELIGEMQATFVRSFTPQESA